MNVQESKTDPEVERGQRGGRQREITQKEPRAGDRQGESEGEKHTRVESQNDRERVRATEAGRSGEIQDTEKTGSFSAFPKHRAPAAFQGQGPHRPVWKEQDFPQGPPTAPRP